MKPKHTYLTAKDGESEDSDATCQPLQIGEEPQVCSKPDGLCPKPVRVIGTCFVHTGYEEGRDPLNPDCTFCEANVAGIASLQHIIQLASPQACHQG